MAGKSNIEWTGHSWNPLAGCTVLTPGCKRCYAMKMAARLEAMGQELYAGLTKPSNAGPVWTGVVREAPDHVLRAPLKRRKPTTYFVNSMSDLFHEDVPDESIDRIFAVMVLTPHHIYQILTKRAVRMLAYITDPQTPVRISRIADMMVGFSLERPSPVLWPRRNVWLGVSTERQQEAQERIPFLLATPAAIRFLSCEPLLGPLNLRSLSYESGSQLPKEMRVNEERCTLNALEGRTTWPNSHYVSPTIKRDAIIERGTLFQSAGESRRIDWAIVGGESGAGAREFDLQWARDIVAQCRVTKTRCFVKQLGARVVGPHENGVNLTTYRFKNRKGGDPAEWPADLRVREMPRTAA